MVMPPSNALQEFNKGLNAADALLTLEAKYADPPLPADEAIVRGLRGGAAVLMVASLEQYVKDAIPERLTPLAATPPPVPFDDLPKNLRVSAMFNHLQRSLDGPRFLRTERVSRIPAIRAASTAVHSQQLVPTALAPESSPISYNIISACESLGLKKVFEKLRTPFMASWGKPEAHTFVRDKLDEVVRRRHKVAHTADALSLARADLNDGAKFLRAFAPVLDTELEIHVTWIMANPGSERP